jgi:hypothetical protein
VQKWYAFRLDQTPRAMFKSHGQVSDKSTSYVVVAVRWQQRQCYVSPAIRSVIHCPPSLPDNES